MRSGGARSAVVVLAVALTSATWTCSRAPVESAAAAPPPRLTTVSLNFTPSITYGPLMIAKDEGFFEEEGIDADFVRLDSTTSLMALVGGEIDVVSIGIRASVFNLIQRGEPLQIVVGKGHAGPDCIAEAFIAPSVMAERIAKAGGSVRGERMVVVRGSVVEFMGDQLLARHNLTIEDVVPVSLPQGSVMSTRAGADAVRFVGEPYLSLLLAEGESKVVVTSDEVAPRHQSTTMLFGKRLLQDDPDLGRRFMRAYLRGVRQWNDGATDRNVEIVVRHTDLPEEAIRGMCWTTTEDDGRIDPRDVQPFLDWALEKKYLDAPITTTWWNPSFIDDAARSLGQRAP